jgi:hypothetical protein
VRLLCPSTEKKGKILAAHNQIDAGNLLSNVLTFYLVSRITYPRQMFVCSSPQTYHSMHGRYSEVHSDCVLMLLKTSTIKIRILREEHNLPVVFDSLFLGKKRKLWLPICVLVETQDCQLWHYDVVVP